LRIKKDEVEKLAKKGWSKSKIERWKADKLKSLEKQNLKKRTIVNANYGELENWSLFLKELFAQTNLSKFGIILHWYSGYISTERIVFKETVKTRIDKISISFFKEMEEDVLYEFVK